MKDSHRRLLLALLLLAGVALLWWLSQPPSRVEQPLPIASTDNAGIELPALTPLAALDYQRDIKPLLDRRCVVCHACYDAPCQLKLDTAAGILRGASKTPVYDGTRLTAAAPSRLDLDALLTAEWRARNFFPVLNEGAARPETNLAASLLYQMLLLKREHPLPPGALPAQLDVSLEREMQCPAPEEFERYARRTPLGGMPFALPGLTDDEFRRIERWLAGGAPVAAPPELPIELRERVAAWEKFLNGDSPKRQLMARYLFEHWFIADLFFSDDPAVVRDEPATVGDALAVTDRSDTGIEPRQFFQIVRSRTPPGQPIAPIATRRPYDDPEVARVWYRLQPQQGARLAKTHLPYALSEVRMARLSELFLGDDYRVETLPDYEPELAANPFATFAAIPVKARYQFLLDDAQFIIGNFIKGPVCRGQLALNVINDRFWVLFADPDIEAVVDGDFLARESANLRLPGEFDPEFNLVELAEAWQRYERQQQKFLAAKAEHLHSHFGDERPVTLDLIWEGDGGSFSSSNRNAALTVFRHFDSASVVQGLVGAVPKTAWVVDYSLLERIHYLLVAGFDVYGSASHQLLTRLYMDFLRMEGEYNFLHFLPLSLRDAERERWYQGLGASARDEVFRAVSRYNVDTAIRYRSADPKAEFFERIGDRLGPALDNRYALPGTGSDWSETSRAALTQLAAVRGVPASLLPEISFIRVLRKGAPDAAFTLLRDSDHSNVAVLLLEQQRRRPQRDRLTLVPGFIGAYPNAFFVVPEEELPRLQRLVRQLQNDGDYQVLLRYYGVLRADPAFWRYSDWFHRAYRETEPLGWGLFDYNRYQR